MRLSALLVVVLAVACVNFPYSAEDCAADVDLANQLVVEVLHEEIDDEAKVRKAALYATIAARLADRGCSLIPETMPE